jgi:hypothetical protein
MSRPAAQSDKEEIHQTAIKYLLDKYGRKTYEGGMCGIYDSEVIPFNVYHPALVTNYEPIVNDEMCDRLKRKKLLLDGFDASGEILSEEVYESIIGYELPQVMRLRAKELGVAFEEPSTDKLVEMLKEAQEASVEQYHQSAKISKKLSDSLHTIYDFAEDEFNGLLELASLFQKPEQFDRLIKEQKQLGLNFRPLKEKELDLTPLEMLYLLRKDDVLFLHALCGTGKSTHIEEIRALAEHQFLVGFDDSGLIRKPLANFWVIDSGEFLKKDGFITPEQVMESLERNLDEFRYALRKTGPIAVVDAGDNLGMRLAMYRLVTEIRPESWIHTMLLTVSELETVVRNQMRAREEYSPNPQLVYQTFEAIRECGDSWSEQDFSSPTYNRMYDELYNVQCNHSIITTFGQWSSCENPAHPPEILCEGFCQKCSDHCSRKHSLKTTVYCTVRCTLYSAATLSSPSLVGVTSLLICQRLCVISSTLIITRERRMIVYS